MKYIVPLMSWFSSRPAGWRNIKLGKFSPILVSAFAAGTLYSGYVFFNLPSKTEATQKVSHILRYFGSYAGISGPSVKDMKRYSEISLPSSIKVFCL